MAKIQIKRYNGSTTSWENQFPITKAQHIRNANDTDNIFDATDKIKLNYLPDAVFDSLYFYTTLGGGPSNLHTIVADAITNAASINRSVLGYYWVSSSGGTTLTASPTTPVQATLGSGAYYRTVLTPSDEGTTGTTVTT